ncbi:Endonuclease-reverse transcriptase [Popillia japonica]|uniref:Endonuclease-reverse transcriptase n=1 Tax=Popillia japonica TaxID=7064 RepID=A0AAW1KSJ0_POPJA
MEDIAFCIEMLSQTLYTKLEQYSQSKWIIAGDFNARVGQLNQLEESQSKWIIAGDFNARVGQLNQLEEEVTGNCYLTSVRNSRDYLTNNRGKNLIEAMESNGFLLANGRTPSDSPADYTYVSKTGSSVIDLLFLNDPSGLRDLSVVDFLHSSPHLPVIVEMATDVVYANQKDEKEMATQYIFRWDEGKVSKWLPM